MHRFPVEFGERAHGVSHWNVNWSAKMKLISHRHNTIDELKATPKEYGVEVDIRSDDGKLVIHHDPFA